MEPSKESTEATKKPIVERAKEGVGKIKTHLGNEQTISLSNWALYAFVGMVVLTLIGGAIQEVRLWRYNKMLRASKIRINELDSRVQTAKLEGIREVATKQHKLNQAEIKKIDEQIKEQSKKQEKLKKSVGRMSGSDLLKAFKEEGF